jgi:hypothetical protein
LVESFLIWILASDLEIAIINQAMSDRDIYNLYPGILVAALVETHKSVSFMLD